MEYPTIIRDQIQISDVAKKKLADLLSNNDGACAIRLFVLGGGCSGMSYSMSFANEKFDTDSVYTKDDVTVYIDPIALNYLSGVQIDYSENQMGSSFLFNNVFQVIGGTGGCAGCGSTQA